MIKKTTVATFRNGDYAGQYDWKGGIPLTVGETISITLPSTTKLDYKLVNKQTSLEDDGQDQLVTTSYFFELA